MAEQKNRFRARAITVLGAVALSVGALAGTAAATVQPAAVQRCTPYSVSGGITLNVCVNGTLTTASGSADLFVNGTGAAKLRNLDTEWDATLLENGNVEVVVICHATINTTGVYRCPTGPIGLPKGVTNWETEGSTDALHRTTNGHSAIIFLSH